MPQDKSYNHSYWEIKQYFQPFELIVIGSGLVGLSTAVSFKKKHKKARVLVLERGVLPDGASTKNAGFACFGSAGELLDDLNSMSEQAVWETVSMRWHGLKLLRQRLGDKNIAYKGLGGFELFDKQDEHEQVCEQLPVLNKQLQSLLGIKHCFTEQPSKARQFRGIRGLIKNQFEGQLDTAALMSSLTTLARSMDIKILNAVTVSDLKDGSSHVEIGSDAGMFKAKKLVVATNGFAAQLLNLKDLRPARAQVLITKPIESLKLKGAFHYQQGYYYFRNIDNRVLFGGGRNMDIAGETTTEQALNPRIQEQLDHLLKTMILPGTPFEIEQRWTGIMGVGSEKKPIIENVSRNVVAAVRMGGMGIAIGSLVGELAAEKIA